MSQRQQCVLLCGQTNRLSLLKDVLLHGKHALTQGKFSSLGFCSSVSGASLNHLCFLVYVCWSHIRLKVRLVLVLCCSRHATFCYLFLLDTTQCMYQKYSELSFTLNFCKSTVQIWRKGGSPPISLNALLCLRETLGKQPRRTDGTKHHITSLCWCSIWSLPPGLL